MIYFPLSKFVDSAEVVTAAGAIITAEGQALVRAPGAPASGVMQSMAASATEIFAGFAVAGVSAAPLPNAYAVQVETFVVPGSGIVALAYTPVAGQVLVQDVTAGSDVATPTVVANTITGLTAGDTVNVTY